MRRPYAVSALLLFGVVYASGFPVVDDQMIQPISDTAVVESTIREVRAARPSDLEGAGSKKAYIHKYGDEDGDDNTHGYHKRTQNQGSDGYKHYDSYHKKDGDKYGYEKHTQYGYGEHQGAGSENHESIYGKPKEEKREAAETKNTYQVSEEYDGDDGESSHYTAGGGSYSDGDESGGQIEGDSGSYEGGGGESSSYSTGGGESSSYSSGGGDGGSYGYSGEGEGSSGHYTAASDGDGEAESEHYSEEGDDGDY